MTPGMAFDIKCALFKVEAEPSFSGLEGPHQVDVSRKGKQMEMGQVGQCPCELS